MLILTTNLAVWMSAVTDESVHKAESKKPETNTSHRMSKLTGKHKNYDQIDTEGITLSQQLPLPWQPNSGGGGVSGRHVHTAPSTQRGSTSALHSSTLRSCEWCFACERKGPPLAWMELRAGTHSPTTHTPLGRMELCVLAHALARCSCGLVSNRSCSSSGPQPGGVGDPCFKENCLSVLGRFSWVLFSLA